MRLIVQDQVENITTVTELETVLEIADFDVGQGKIPATLFEAKGDLVVGSGSGTYDNFPAGTNGQVLVARSGETLGVKWEDQMAASISAQFWLGVSAGIIPTTDPCGGIGQDTETSTYKHNVFNAPFDATAEEHIEFQHAMPSDYDGDVVTAKFYWYHPATTVNFDVVWGIEAVCVGNDEALDASWGTAATVTDTGGTTSDLYVSASTSNLTIGGTPAAGEIVRWRVYRKAADASDTLAVDAKLVGVMITYGRAG